jgi:ceramide glucosyltransferase
VLLAAKSLLALRYAAGHDESGTLDAPVTIVQPILGGDPFLEEALRRNLEQAPPAARFLWLVDEDDAEGRRVVSRLGEGRADVLLCPPAAAGQNPKTVKLQRALAAVDTPYIAVLDDDTILSPGHLGRALFALQSCTLYTGLPCYLRGANVWSSLVSHFVNNNSILTYLPLLPLTGPLTINGMYYVMRTADLVAMGGFAPIVTKLCDDYALAALVRRRGGTIRQGTTPQFLRTTVPHGADYLRIMQRWFLFANVLLRDQPPRVRLLLGVFLGLPPLLFWLSFLALAGGLLSSLVLAGGLLTRHLVLRALHRMVFRGRPHFRWAMSIAAELLQPLHWLHACVQHSLRWRTRHIQLGPDGTFVYLGGER